MQVKNNSMPPKSRQRSNKKGRQRSEKKNRKSGHKQSCQKSHKSSNTRCCKRASTFRGSDDEEELIQTLLSLGMDPNSEDKSTQAERASFGFQPRKTKTAAQTIRSPGITAPGKAAADRRRRAQTTTSKVSLDKLNRFAEMNNAAIENERNDLQRAVHSENIRFQVSSFPTLSYLNRKDDFTEGSGNCQFHAVLKSLRDVGRERVNNYFLRDLDHRRLRNLAVTHILNNRTIYQEFVENRNLTEYIRKMKVDGEWGDNATLYALSNVFKVTFIVHYNDNIPPLQVGNGGEAIIHLAYYQDSHWASTSLR